MARVVQTSLPIRRGPGMHQPRPLSQLSRSVSPSGMGGTIRRFRTRRRRSGPGAHRFVNLDPGAFDAAEVRFVDRTQVVDVA